MDCPAANCAAIRRYHPECAGQIMPGPFGPARSSPLPVFIVGNPDNNHPQYHRPYFSAFVELFPPEPASVPDVKLGFIAEEHRNRSTLEATERFIQRGIDVEDVDNALDQ